MNMKTLAALFVGVACTLGASATVRNVDYASGTDDVSVSPWKTLKFAIENADPDDEIVLAKGRHLHGEAVDVDKALTIRGAGENWETVVDGQAGNSGLTLSAAGIRIHNLTFTRFGGTWGKKFVLSMSSESVISNVVVTGSCPASTAATSYPVYAEAGLITHCWVTNNQSQGAAGVGLAGTATMENCYIARNTRVGDYTYGGVDGIVELSSANATLRNCTIVDNSLNGSGALACKASAKVYNNIIWNNLDKDQTANLYFANSPSTANWLANCTTPITALTGVGNTAGNPQFKEDRMHIQVGSSCKWTANPDVAPAYDIEGTERGATPSIGAFEYVDTGDIGVEVEATATFVRQPGTITLTASPIGPVTYPVQYAWDLDGDGNPDRTEASVVLTDVGIYRPTLSIVDSAGKPASAEFTDVICVHEEGASTFFVDFAAGVDGENTGLEPDNPLKSLSYALRSPLLLEGDEIVLAKGTHLHEGLVDIDKALTIRGAGENWETVVDGRGANGRLTLSAAGVRIHNLTFSRFGANFCNPIVFNMVAAGVISNVVVTGTCPTDYAAASYPVYAEAGLITHCWVTNNQSQGAAGVGLAGTATMENCYIARNTRVGDYTYGGVDGIVELSSANATLRNCTIVDNSLNGSGALACKASAKVCNNIIWNNLDQGQTTNLYFAKSPSTANWLANCTTPTNGLAGAGNIEGDPLLKDDRMRFFADSPCRDAGDDTLVAPGETDLRGRPRKIGGHVDIGCLEYKGGLSVLVR